MVYDEEYPLNDGYCDMLNQARYCVDPDLLKEEMEDTANINKYGCPDPTVMEGLAMCP